MKLTKANQPPTNNNSVNFFFKGIGQLLHILIEDAYICKFLAKHLNFGAYKLDKSEKLLFTKYSGP